MAARKRQFTGERLVAGDSMLTPMRVENLARFRFFLARASGARALDLGCGVGEGTAFLRAYIGWQVVGVDLASEALIAAEQEYGASGAHFVQSDVRHLGFVAELFDAIISVEVIEHLTNPVPYLLEAARVLRTGGIFFLTTPNRLRSSPTPGSLWPEHVREYSPDELAALLQSVFPRVELWGETVPVYEAHLVRRLVRRLAPYVKPWLPGWLRIRALPMLQFAIKPDLQLDDVCFTQGNIEEMPTLVAVCGR